MSVRWNFARRPFRDERPIFGLTAMLLLGGALFFAANLSLYWKFSRQVEGTRSQIALLEERRAKTERAAGEARAALGNYKLSSMAEESAALQRIVRERRFSWLALLGRLERTLPSDVRLVRLAPRFDSAESVSLDMAVVGKSADSVVGTLAALAKDRAFHDIELRSESSPETGVPEGYAFQIAMRYEPEVPR